MSFSFKKFVSAMSEAVSDKSKLQECSNASMPQQPETEAEDLTGNLSSLLLLDPAVGHTNSAQLSSQMSESNRDSPESGSSDVSSTKPKFFSDVEKFIAATLSAAESQVKMECEDNVETHSDNKCNYEDECIITSEQETNNIIVDKSCSKMEINDLISGAVDSVVASTDNIAIDNLLRDEDTLAKDQVMDDVVGEGAILHNIDESNRVKEEMSELDVEKESCSSKSALNTPYVEDSSLVTKNNNVIVDKPPNSVNDDLNKIWRDGMDKKSAESSKTMFISQNLTKKYDKADAQIKGVTYKVCVSKCEREITYFKKMLQVIGADMHNTEYTMSPDQVLKMREVVKGKLANLKTSIDEFVLETLEGQVKDEPPAKQEPVEKVRVEYIHPPKKKTPKEAKAELCLENVDVANSLHKCVDCGHFVTIGEGETLEMALEKHSHSTEHKNCISGDQVGEKGTPGSQKQQREKAENMKKALDKVSRQNVLNHTQSRQMMLNQIISQTVNGVVMLSCNPCGGEVITVEAFSLHVNTFAHNDNLNNFNIRLQKDMIVKYPDLFGPGKMFSITDLHIVMNKIFVDPLAKYSYCGLCKKELPTKQTNIDEHITSKNHEKLLLTSMEGKVSKVHQRDADSTGLTRNRNMDFNLEVAASEYADNVNATMQRNLQDRRSSGSSAQACDIEEKDLRYGVMSPDGKFICLLCDARGITSLQNLISHFNGGPHKVNLDNAKQSRGGVEPDTQHLFIKNMISITYGRFPLIFECFACNTTPFAGIQAAMDHINSQSHMAMVLYKQRVQKTQQPKTDRNDRRPSVITNVILHRNGVNYWCLSCRCELQDVSIAYKHVLLPGHLNTSVEGVLMLQGTQFYCEHCLVMINGEKNVGQHIVSPKHRQQVTLASKANTNRDSRTPPSFSRNQQVKKIEDERNGNKSLVQSADDGKIKAEERILLHRNYVNILKKNLFQCRLCDCEQMTRPKILTHIFSYEHVLKMQNQMTSNS